LNNLEPGCSVSKAVTVPVPESADSFVVEAFLEGDRGQNKANDQLVFPVLTSPGLLVINEIMYRPEEGSSEWLELYNRGPYEVNLRGWSISDSRNRRRRITGSDFWFYPGSYLLIAQEPQSLLSELRMRKDLSINSSGGNGSALEVIGVEGGWPVLNDYPGESDMEVITIRDRWGRVAERAGYEDLLDGERGRSIERYSALVCSSMDGGIWHRCGSNYGSTPGAENSVSGRMTASLTIAPNPFMAGRNRSVEISGMVGEGLEGFLVRIFRMNGKEVTRIFGEKRGAHHYSCFWDGRDSTGEPVGTGLYICAVEYFSSGGCVLGREKKCIAVSSGASSR
jgi:hypothetical protein